MSLRSLLALFIVIKFGCMVNMGNSSSSATMRPSREDNHNDYNDDNSVSDVSIACIKAHLRSGVPAKEFMVSI